MLRVKAKLNGIWRSVTNRWRFLPHFIILGAQRAGTTSFYKYLTAHPAIAGARNKEVHFYDNNYSRGYSWYRAQFPLQRPGIIAGEASPYYLFHPLVHQRIKNDAQIYAEGVPKFIVLLRDPVERAISHYKQVIRLGIETLSFAEAIASEEKRLVNQVEMTVNDDKFYSSALQHFSYIARGRYIEQVEAWLSLFPAGQFLFLKSEDMYADPASALKKALTFLNVDCNDQIIAEIDFKQHNSTESRQFDKKLIEDLQHYFRPYNERLDARIGILFNSDHGSNSCESAL